MATAEGTPFAISEVVDTKELTGSLSASIDWGDGTVTPGEVVVGGGSSLVGRVDYSLDTNNFFDSQLKKDLFQQAVDTILSRLGDDLAAITPSDGNSWTAEFAHPGTGVSEVIPNLPVGENEIVIFAGGRELGTSLGIGGPGGFNVSCTIAEFCESVATRGEAGASGDKPTDFGLWGGVVAFDTTADFHFSQSLDGLTGTQKSDFLSVALHEVTHLLGFGASLAWQANVSNNMFVGPAAREANGNQSVPLSPTGGHWTNGTTSGGQETAMDPSLTNGQRKVLTPLDYAGLADIGWELISPAATVSGTHTYGDDGVYDVTVLLEGSTSGTATRTLQETVTNEAPMLESLTTHNVGFGQPFTIVDIGTFTDAGYGANEVFTYDIDWGDGTLPDGGSAAIDAVGSPGVVTRGSFDGTHVYAAGGTYSVTISVMDDDGGKDSVTLELVAGSGIVVDIEAEAISENDGPNATTVTISRGDIDLALPLLVNLSTDSSELTIPATVEIEAGQSMVVVPIDAVDDDLLDGTQGVTISATAIGFISGSDTVLVTDHEVVSLQLADSIVGENAGDSATQLTVTRSNTDLDSSLLVFLGNSDDSLVSIPVSVTIPFGEPSVTVTVAAIDNDLLGDNAPVTISATANGYAGSSTPLTLSDHETLVLTIDTAIILEADGRKAATATVTRNNVNTELPLAVEIAADDSEVLVPRSVVIPARASSVTFDIDAVDDQIEDGTQAVVLSAIATGYVGGEASVQVAEALSWQNPALQLDVNNDGSVSPIDALQVINDLNALGSRELPAPSRDSTPPFLDVNGDGFTSALDVLLVVNFLNSGGEQAEGEAFTESLLVCHCERALSVSHEPAVLLEADNYQTLPEVANRSERKIILFSDQFVDSLRDNIVADFGPSFD